MIRLFVSDLDGTLLDDKGGLDPEFFTLLEELKEKNILFAIATGRQVPNVKKLFAPVINDVIIIAENGAYVSYKGEEIFSAPIPKEQMKELIKYTESIPETAIFMCCKEVGYLNNNSEKMNEIGDFYNVISKYVEDISLVDDDVLKFAVCNFIDAKTNALPILKKKFSDILEVEASGEVWIDITKKGINKGVGLQVVQEKFGISIEETLAVGDNDNDVKMMERAFYSYAMKESSSELRKAAKFSIGSNNENSALKLMKSLIDGEVPTNVSSVNEN